ncbi:hypothetical protein SO802_015220 [Lithocarpus litseifolius]|uniref:Uncharacterized protein n=1 Tax=Lithocarpus litseifolius TaxID=425828 RepID=A0AAW2CTQ4_9ROSI
MATRYSKDKYAHVKGMKNEPLSQLAVETKKRKLNEEKGETTTSPIICTVPSSPTPSLKMMTFSPPTIHSKGKSKIGKRIWEDPATTLGRAHNVVTNEELKGLSSIPSHKLVLGKSLHLMTVYLSTEEKVVVANSKVESMEAESSRLQKDLIEAMDEATKAKGKVKELNEALKVEKLLVAQKDDEIQAALLQTDEECEKAIDIEALADEAKEQEEATAVAVEGNGATKGRPTDEACVHEGHVNEVVIAP